MITNGQTMSLSKTILAVYAACFPENTNFTGRAGPWKFFFNRGQGIYVVRDNPINQIILWGATTDNLRDGLLVISRDTEYDQIMSALEEVTMKLRDAAEAYAKHAAAQIERMKKLDKFYAVLGEGIRTRKEVSTKFKKYQMPQ